MSRRVTMADVAKQAGVSLMTVSRIVNNKGDISEATTLRVQGVIERLGYRPSGIARSLATSRTRTLGLVVPDNANPFFSEVARGAEHLAYQEGYNIFLCNTEEQKQREMDVLRSLEEKQVDGIILVSSRLDEDDLRAVVMRSPTTVLVNRHLKMDGVGEVLIDAIGVLAGPPASYSGQRRAEGYLATMQSAGLTPQPGWVANCPPRIEGGMDVACQMLKAHPELTALFCYNDLVAIGALKACTQMGLPVPTDIAIVGYDDILLAGLVTPALTTCYVPRYEIGQQAVSLLLEHIGGCEGGCEEIMVQPELVVRASAP
jgi:LacI family transcriptional regulator